MGDHVSMMEAQFSRLASMISFDSEPVMMALNISSLANWPEYSPMIASVSTLQKDLTKWNYVSMLLFE